MIILASSYWPWLIFAAILIFTFLIFRQLSQPRRLPYEKRGALVTKSELKFYHVLREAIDGRWTLFAMVRIADLVRVEKGTRKYRSWLNKILAKHVDFVLCDSENLEPILAIELDDRSHERPERIARDELVNQVFESSELLLLRVPVQKSYDAEELRNRIHQSLGLRK